MGSPELLHLVAEIGDEIMARLGPVENCSGGAARDDVGALRSGQKVLACSLARRAGADSVRTSTGTEPVSIGASASVKTEVSAS